LDNAVFCGLGIDSLCTLSQIVKPGYTKRWAETQDSDD